MYKKWLLIPIASVSLILLLALVSFILPQRTATGETTDFQILESLNTAFIEVAKIARPSVVNISTTTTVSQSSSGRQEPWDFWEEFFGRPSPREQRKQERKQSAQYKECEFASAHSRPHSVVLLLLSVAVILGRHDTIQQEFSIA